MARLTVRLTPRAGRNAIDGWREEVLIARVAAAPVDGGANEALLRMVAKRLRIARSKVTLVSGAQSRTKILEITDLSDAEIRDGLSAPDR